MNTKAEFLAAMAAAGLPTTETAIKAKFQELVDAAGITITNTSAQSPFWNLQTAIATAPAEWFINFLAEHELPNQYLMTATGDFLDLLAQAVSVYRKPATTAIGNLTFSRTETTGSAEIPSGTVVRTITINSRIFRVTTTATATLADGVSTVQVPAIAEAEGAAYNLGANYYTIIESHLPGFTVTNAADWLTIPGADTETDEALRLRAQNQFTAVGEWHTDAKYKAMIAGMIGIAADRVYFDHSAPRGPGSADAYVLFETWEPAATHLDTVNAYITSGNRGHGDDLLVKAVPAHSVDLTVTVYGTASLSDVENFIRCAFRENSEYDDFLTKTAAEATFSFSLLSQELHNFFPTLSRVVFSLGDITTAMAVPRLNTLTVQAGS